jgi:predicted DsbA family dithiol-disulfide isomerase
VQNIKAAMARFDKKKKNVKENVKKNVNDDDGMDDGDEAAAAVFNYRWLPFMLNPSTPQEGMTIQDYMRMKGYHPDFYPRAHQRLVKMGKEAGVLFNQQGKGNGNTVVNTLNSIRLIDYAQATLPNHEANRFVEAVVWAHHVHGKDISDPVQLTEIGVEFGLKGPPLLAFIEDPKARAPVPGSDKAKAAIAGGQVEVPSLTCAGDGAEEDGTCNPQADHHHQQQQQQLQRSGGGSYQVATNDTFVEVGDAHSVVLRDLQAKRDLGIHAVPHIELWRDVRKGPHGVDCAVQWPSKRRSWIGVAGGPKGVFGDAIVISGAMPMEHFLAAFGELASMSVVLEEY